MSGVAQRCARCGRPVPQGEHLCSQCREEEPVRVLGTSRAPPPDSELEERRRRWPPGMVRPSPVQYHATVMMAVAAVLVGLALLALFNHRSVGPFRTSELHLRPQGRTAVTVTFRVTNNGSREARSTCRITAEDHAGVPVRSESVLTRPIPGGGAVSVRHTLTGLPIPAAHLKIDCT
jgi:hypothetical protein